MPMYAGDEEVSDAESECDEFDHNFEAVEVCVDCGESADNCDCADNDNTYEAEFEDSDECAICGMSEADLVHGN